MNLLMRRMLGALEHGTYTWTTPGTYSLRLKQRTRAKITAVGSGCDRHHEQSWLMGYSHYWAGGYGGGVFIGEAMLPSGVYTIQVGDTYHYTYNSEFDNHEHDAATTTATLISHNTIGTLLSITQSVIKSENFEIIAGTVESDVMGKSADITATNGVYYGGASWWNGYGKGSDSNESNYTTGYFSIEF